MGEDKYNGLQGLDQNIIKTGGRGGRRGNRRKRRKEGDLENRGSWVRLIIDPWKGVITKGSIGTRRRGGWRDRVPRKRSDEELMRDFI